jgi:hypothetical protein
LAQKVVRLHVGVHKTATTYLQQYLLQNRGTLAREGLAYWPMEDIRVWFKLAWEQQVLNRHSWRGRLSTRIRGDRALARMREWFDLDRDILLSEENLLGEGADFFDGAVYPDAAARLVRLAAALPKNRPLEVWLCLRSYPDFLASMYGEAARFWKVPAPEVFVERHANPAGRWPELVDRIRAALPQARLHVWAYEDFRRLEPRIVEGMTGLSPARLQPLQQADVRPSASDRAIRACAALPDHIQGAERMFRMLELEELYPMQDRSDRFSPWTSDQRAQMEAAWQRDRDHIAGRADVFFLQ